MKKHFLYALCGLLAVFAAGCSNAGADYVVTSGATVKDNTLNGSAVVDGTLGGAKIQDNGVGLEKITHTGVPDNSTFLRGDGRWAPKTYRGALAHNGGGQTIASGSLVKVMFPYESSGYDTDNIHSVATDNAKLVVPPGVSMVRVTAQIVFDPNPNGSRFGNISKNGGSGWVGYPYTVTVPDNTMAASVTMYTPVISVSPGDYFEVVVFQTSGSALGIGTLADWFSMEIIQ